MSCQLISLFIYLQDWSEILVGVDVVYPMYYFISMTALVAGTSAVLYKAQVIGYDLLCFICFNCFIMFCYVILFLASSF